MKAILSSIIVDGEYYTVRTIIEAPHPIDQLAAAIMRREIKW
jgi:hypothetical protein